MEINITNTLILKVGQPEGWVKTMIKMPHTLIHYGKNGLEIKEISHIPKKKLSLWLNNITNIIKKLVNMNRTMLICLISSNSKKHIKNKKNKNLILKNGIIKQKNEYFIFYNKSTSNSKDFGFYLSTILHTLLFKGLFRF